jgi:hypothetical protein
VTRRFVPVFIVSLLLATLGAGPVQAAAVHGGVVAAYEFYDANRNVADNASVRLRQTYLLNAEGAVWAPEVASYRSNLRYDVVTESLEHSGGAFSDGIRSFGLEARVFPLSPLNLTAGANVTSARNDGRSAADGPKALDEFSLYGRFWLGFASLPPTSVQVSHNTSAARRSDAAGSEIRTRDLADDNLTLTTTFRQPAAQTQVTLQTGRTVDQLTRAETSSRATSVQFTGTPSPKLQVRAGAELSGVDTVKTSSTQTAQRAGLSARVRYLMDARQSVQVTVTGGRTRLALDSGEREDYATSAATQYTRALGSGLQGILTADYRRVQGGTLSNPLTNVERGRATLRGEVTSIGQDRLTWLSALSYEEVEEASARKPGATVEGRVDYQWQPSLTLGLGTVVYRSLKPEVLAATDPLGRVGMRGSLRWAAGRAGRVSLSLQATEKAYAAATGRDTGATLAAGVTPRDDLDLTADVQALRTETPGMSVPWQNSLSFSGAALFRPRPDLTVNLTLSRQGTEDPGGLRYQQTAAVKAEYLFYALRFGGNLMVVQAQDGGADPRDSFELSLSVRRDF